MLEVSSALKSDCNGLFGFTASAPAVAVRLTGTDDMLAELSCRVRMAMGDEEWMVRDGLDSKKSAHASKVSVLDVGGKKFDSFGLIERLRAGQKDWRRFVL